MNRPVYSKATAAAVAALVMLVGPVSAFADTVDSVIHASSSSTTAAPMALPPKGRPGPVEVEEPLISQEEALALVTAHFTIPEGRGKLDVYLNDWGPNQTYNLSYTVQTEGGSTGYGIGTIDARTGKLLDMNLNMPELRPIRTGPAVQTYSEEQARARAWTLVRELYPEEASNLQLATGALAGHLNYSYYGQQAELYRFTWTKMHNGVPVIGSQIVVEMDPQTLDFVGFRATLPKEVAYDSATATITPAEALEAFRAAAKPELAYQSIADGYMYGGDTTGMRLVYRVGVGGLVDVSSGELMDGLHQPLPLGQELKRIEVESTPAAKPPKLPLDEPTAIAIAGELLGIPAAERARMIQHWGQSSDQKELNLYYNPEDGGGASVTLNRETGRILWASRYGPYVENDDRATKLTDEQRAKVEEAAVALVQRYYGDFADQLAYYPLSDDAFSYPRGGAHIYFMRYHNGIPVASDGISFSIDPTTMQWNNMSFRWTTDVAFTDPDGVIDPEVATERFFAGREAVLVYQEKPDLDRMFGPWSPQAAPTQLTQVYVLAAQPTATSASLIDAFTGELVDWNGHTVLSKEAINEILAGHWAEGELRLMLSTQALLGDQLDPDGALNRAEALRLFVTGTVSLIRYGYYDRTPPYVDVKPGTTLYSLVQQGYQQGVLKPSGEQPVFGADQPATRAEFALWMVRQLGLGNLAQSKLKPASGFTDLGELAAEERNAVAFLEALEILSPGERFRGKEPVTQAEAAAMTVRMIKYLRESK